MKNIVSYNKFPYFVLHIFNSKYLFRYSLVKVKNMTDYPELIVKTNSRSVVKMNIDVLGLTMKKWELIRHLKYGNIMMVKYYLV